MPIYEYCCDKCHQEFEELVFGDDTPPCPHCGAAQTQKLISRPCRHHGGEGDGGDYAPPSGGGKCAGCSGGNCASCH